MLDVQFSTVVIQDESSQEFENHVVLATFWDHKDKRSSYLGINTLLLGKEQWKYKVTKLKDGDLW